MCVWPTSSMAISGTDVPPYLLGSHGIAGVSRESNGLVHPSYS